MSVNPILIREFLGKYYTELLYSSAQEKYKNTGLDTFFEQRFYIQTNKVQMVVDPSMPDMTIVVNGNEIYISKDLYDHPSIVVSNSIENNQATNPRSLYSPEVFSTLAYLICQNHMSLQIIGEIDEPIYVKYKSDFETFQSSVIIFNISDGVEVEIVEEIESNCALNSVTNYILNPFSHLKLTTFYQNNVSALSFCYRNVIAQENSTFNHVLLGKGSSNIIDENKIKASNMSSSELLGIVNSAGRNFHSILYVEPVAVEYHVSVVYKDILSGHGKVSYFPVIQGNLNPEFATIEVSNITLEEIPAEKIENEIKEFVSDIIDRVTLERMTGVKRFYDNKTRFMHFP